MKRFTSKYVKTPLNGLLICFIITKYGAKEKIN